MATISDAECVLLNLKTMLPKRMHQCIVNAITYSILNVKNCVSIESTHKICADVTFCITKSSGEYLLPNTSDYDEESLQITAGRQNAYEVNCKYGIYEIFI